MGQETTITVQHREKGAVEVPGTVYGPLAVHQDLDEGSGAYTVSHVRTGYRVQRQLPVWAAEMLALRLGGLDWDFDQPGGMPVETVKEGRRIIKDVLRECGLR